MNSKSVFLSKTFWVNILAMAAALGGVFHFNLSADDQAMIVTGIMGVVNIILRFLTKQPVHVVTADVGTGDPGNGGNN